MSQRAVAERMGYTTPQFISNWERGLTTPPEETFIEVVVLYGVELQEADEFLANIYLAEIEEFVYGEDS